MTDGTRAEILNAFGLRDRAIFDVGPDSGCRAGAAQVRVAATGDPCQHFSADHAAKLARALDGVDVPLAARIRRAALDAAKHAKG